MEKGKRSEFCKMHQVWNFDCSWLNHWTPDLFCKSDYGGVNERALLPFRLFLFLFLFIFPFCRECCNDLAQLIWIGWPVSRLGSGVSFCYVWNCSMPSIHQRMDWLQIHIPFDVNFVLMVLVFTSQPTHHCYWIYPYYIKVNNWRVHIVRWTFADE